jgi:hypothetical protein
METTEGIRRQLQHRILRTQSDVINKWHATSAPVWVVVRRQTEKIAISFYEI